MSTNETIVNDCELPKERPSLVTSVADMGIMKILIIALLVFFALNTLGLSWVVSRLSTPPSDVFERVGELQEAVVRLEGKLDAETKKTSEALADQKNKGALNRAYFELIERSEGVYVQLDRNGNVLLWSQGAVEFFGVERDDAEAFGVAHIIPQGRRLIHRAAFDSAMKEEPGDYRMAVNHCECISANGEVPVKITVHLVTGLTAIVEFEEVDEMPVVEKELSDGK